MDENLRLLVVDDHQSMQLVLLNVLKKTFQVAVAKDGFEALSLIKDKVPDVILLDYLLPSMNGLFLLRHIKKSLLFKHIPVVMLTGDQDEKLIKACLQAGASSVLHKPFDPDQLFAALKKSVYPNTITTT